MLVFRMTLSDIASYQQTWADWLTSQGAVDGERLVVTFDADSRWVRVYANETAFTLLQELTSRRATPPQVAQWTDELLELAEEAARDSMQAAVAAGTIPQPTSGLKLTSPSGVPHFVLGWPTHVAACNLESGMCHIALAGTPWTPIPPYSDLNLAATWTALAVLLP